MDAKDILGLPKKVEKKSKPPKESQRKPEGISREVYALTGGLAPFIPPADVSQLKRKATKSDEKITWQWLPFTNSARKDNLRLFHWVRVVNGVPPSGDYSFAMCNKSVDVIKYTHEEYEKYCNDPAWTKEETDQLFDLCEQFDLRFIVIADKFPSSKTVEDLKSRYYSVSRAILLARAPSPSSVADHPLIKETYNASQESERKRALNLLLSHKKPPERRNLKKLVQLGSSDLGVLKEVYHIVMALIHTETPGTPPKRLQQASGLDRTLTPDFLSDGGKRFGKREQTLEVC